MPKQEHTEPVATTINGTFYEGRRTIQGTRKLYQTIEFQNSSKPDPRLYHPGEENYMRAIATQILKELVNAHFKKEDII